MIFLTNTHKRVPVVPLIRTPNCSASRMRFLMCYFLTPKHGYYNYNGHHEFRVIPASPARVKRSDDPSARNHQRRNPMMRGRLFASPPTPTLGPHDRVYLCWFLHDVPHNRAASCQK